MPAGKTYTPLATTTLSTTATTVTFSSISSSYTDLVVVIAMASGNTGDCYLRFNSDSGNNYSDTVVRGNGSTATSVRDSNQPGIDIGPTSVLGPSEIAAIIIQVQNYSNTTTNKTCLIRFNEATGFVNAIVGLWRNTNAITSLSIVSRAGDLGVGSTFTLYGILAA